LKINISKKKTQPIAFSHAISFNKINVLITKLDPDHIRSVIARAIVAVDRMQRALFLFLFILFIDLDEYVLMSHVTEYDRKPVFSQYHRADMETIKSIKENGIEKLLGEVKNFRANEEMNRFIPEQARLAVSWVRLAKNEKLDVHVHPISSLYIICEGEAILLGDGVDRRAVPGDVICIPPGADHGFIGAGDNGYWGLSIQFEERGLYEDPSKPLVTFDQDPYAYYHQLKAHNARYIERYQDNKIFTAFAKDKTFSEAKKSLFLDYLQILSDQFQKMVLLRSALCEDVRFSRFFSEHLKEEFGHDEVLRNSRDNLQVREDAIFEALCIWFNHQMITLDNLEQAILVHFVIEGSAFVFYNNIKHVFDPSKQNHFEDHSEFDGDHQEVDKAFFKGMTEEQFQRVKAVLDKGWSMVEKQYARLAELIEA